MIGYSIRAIASVFLLGVWGQQWVSAELATVHLADGKSLTVELVSVDRGQVQWKANARPDSPVQSFLRSQISYVDFPATGAWSDAEVAFESGKFGEAIQLYRSVIADRFTHFYPIPGNFVSLAQFRILECHRASLNPAEIAKQYGVVREEFPNLPPEMRKTDPVMSAWLAVSKKNWDGVLSALAEVELPGPESFFLKGVALENKGKWEDAVQEYTGVYVLNFGGSRELTKQALQRSATLLANANVEGRKPELQAQVKIYRDLFGGGALWEGAPAWVVELAEEKIDTMDAEMGGDFDGEAPVEGTEGVVENTGGAISTLPPKEERDWLLYTELEPRIYRCGDSSPMDSLSKVGGVSDESGDFVFDGTGGGVRLRGIDASGSIVMLQCRFLTEGEDGVIFDLHTNTNFGLGLYIEGGVVKVSFYPAKRPKLELAAGKVTVNEMNDFRLIFRGDGLLTSILNQNKVEKKGRIGGLRIKTPITGCIGDIGSNDKDVKAVNGKDLIPFRGRIVHFSIGTGESVPKIKESESLMFGGKVIRMNPPVPEPEEGAAPAPKPAAE